MARKEASAVRDALVSAIVAMIVAAVSAVAYKFGAYWLLALIAIGAMTFLGVLYFRYRVSAFYRLVVWACLELLSVFLLVPSLNAAGFFGEDSWIDLVIDSLGTGAFLGLCGVCVVAMIVSAVMDNLKSMQLAEKSLLTHHIPKPRQIETLVSAGDKSLAAGYVEHMEVHFGKEDDDGKGTKKENVKIKPSKPTGKEVEGRWPKESLPLGGIKVSEPFAGRLEELRELTGGMGGDKTIVAVVGMAGQGKSCLAGEWYKRGARPPERVGLFWRKVYEPGFTFDKFLDELHFYLTGEHIDRKENATIEARAVAVEKLLKDKPCWIVLDGVERWLRLWAAEPDAGVENPSADDKSGQDTVFDKFLTGASFWSNGSRLLLTTRAVPSALDDNPPIRIGRKPKAGKKGKEQTDIKDQRSCGTP